MLNRAESKALLKTVASPLQSPQTEVADSRSDAQPEAARRSLQHLLRLHPNDLQVLQLLVLLDQEQGPWPYCGKSKAIQRQFKPCSSRPENGGMPMGGSIP